MNDVMISNLVFVNNYTIPTSTRSSKAPKELFLQSLATGLGEFNQTAAHTGNLANQSVFESQKQMKKQKSTGKIRRTSQKKAKLDKPPDSIFSQRLFSKGPNLEFFTSSHSKLPISGSNLKKQRPNAKFPKVNDLNSLISNIKSKSIQKKLTCKPIDADRPEKSSSRSKKGMAKMKFEPKAYKFLGETEFLSSDSKFKFTKLSPRGDFDSLVKKLKLTCQKSDY